MYICKNNQVLHIQLGVGENGIFESVKVSEVEISDNVHLEQTVRNNPDQVFLYNPHREQTVHLRGAELVQQGDDWQLVRDGKICTSVDDFVDYMI